MAPHLFPSIRKDGPSQSGTHVDSVVGAVAPFQPGPRRRKKKVRSDGENLVPELAGGGGLDVLKFDDTEPRDAQGKWTAADAAQAIHNVLRDSDRAPKYQGSPNPMTGHCYVASEAAYHLIGGKKAGWKPMFVQHEGQPHWYLHNPRLGQNLDITDSQFTTPVPRDKAVGKGFLTKKPSQRAQVVMDRAKATRDPSFLLDPTVENRNFEFDSPNIQSIVDRFKDSGAYDRSEMPQLSGYAFPGTPAGALPKDDRGKVHIDQQFRKYLERHNVKVTDEMVPAGSLKPTQNEVDEKKIAGMIRRHLRSGLDDINPMWVSSDNYVLDGHHRWATYIGEEMARGRPVDIPVIRVDLPMNILLDETNRFADKMGVLRQDVQKALGMSVELPMLKFNQNHDDDGRFATAAGEGLKNGGFTINVTDGSSPTTGYVVAVQGHSKILPCTDPTDPATMQSIENAMFDYLRENHDLFASNPALHLGGWHDVEHGEFVLDPSEVVPDLETARKMGSDRNQQAIWDIANAKEIGTGGTGDREEEGPTRKASGRGKRRGVEGMGAPVRRSSPGTGIVPGLLPVNLDDPTQLTRPARSRRPDTGSRVDGTGSWDPAVLPLLKFNPSHGPDGRFTSGGGSGGTSSGASSPAIDPTVSDKPWTDPPPMTPDQVKGQGRRRRLSALHLPQHGDEERATDASRTARPGTVLHDRTHYPHSPGNTRRQPLPRSPQPDARFAKVDFLMVKEWDPTKHPRGEPGNAGEFGPGGGSASTPDTGRTPPVHQPATPPSTSLALMETPDHISPHLSDTRTMPPRKGETEPREVQNPDNPTATKFDTLPPEFQAKILKQVYEQSPNHLTPEMMDANLEDVWQHAQSDPQALAAKDWYDAANGVADGIAASCNIHLNSAVGMIAAMSPQTDWDSNQAMARFCAEKLRDDAPVNLPEEEIAYRHRQSQASKGDAHNVTIPNGQRLSDMTPGQAAWALYAMASVESLKNGLTTAKGVEKKAQLSMGAQNVAKGVRIFRGESPDSILSGHKVRSFYNNIQDPDDLQGHGDVTVDTHAVSAATGYRVTASGRTIKKMFEGSASTAANVKGAYSLFADAYRRLAAKHGVTPNQAQAIVWVHWQTVKGGHVGYREQHPAIENDVPPKTDKVKAKERETKERAKRKDILSNAGAPPVTPG